MITIKSNKGFCSDCSGFDNFTVKNGRCRECMRTAIEDEEEKIKSIPITNETPEQEIDPGLYICLIHGFKNGDDRIKGQDWGVNGPMIGPLKWVHFTYMSTVRFEFIQGFGYRYDMSDVDNELVFKQDCVTYDGMEYGDFTIKNIGDLS